MASFQISTGEIATGDRLRQAVQAVAAEMRRNAYAIRAEDAYASHVTELTKERNLQDQLDAADCVENGTMRMGLWLWQRVNTVLTGECVALLPKQP